MKEVYLWAGRLSPSWVGASLAFRFRRLGCPGLRSRSESASLLGTPVTFSGCLRLLFFLLLLLPPPPPFPPARWTMGPPRASRDFWVSNRSSVCDLLGFLGLPGFSWGPLTPSSATRESPLRGSPPRCYALASPDRPGGVSKKPCGGLKSDDSFRDGSLPVENGGAVKSQKVTTVPHLRPKRVLCLPGREARSCKVRCDFASPPCPARPREGDFLVFAGKKHFPPPSAVTEGRRRG